MIATSRFLDLEKCLIEKYGNDEDFSIREQQRKLNVTGSECHNDEGVILLKMVIMNFSS